MGRLRFATVWLGGCSGCHMSFLDLDEWLFELAKKVDVVFTPVADVKEYPENVDLALIEGAVANAENEEMLLRVRERTRTIVALGDCAVTGNVTALRNPLGVALEVLRPVYLEKNDLNPAIPDESEIVPVLLDRVVPIHAVVPVDHFLPGCPPSAKVIQAALEALLDGRKPELEWTDRRFG
jgi:NAD-reducing hydrogenase small subunit